MKTVDEERSNDPDESELFRDAMDDDVGMNERVVLNVGGTRFETYVSTLAQYPNTLLGAMFAEHNRCMRPSNGSREIFFDRSPALFEPILAFYRSGRLRRPPMVNAHAFADECEFFQVDAAARKRRSAQTTALGAVGGSGAGDDLSETLLSGNEFSDEEWLDEWTNDYLSDNDNDHDDDDIDDDFDDTWPRSESIENEVAASRERHNALRSMSGDASLSGAYSGSAPTSPSLGRNSIRARASRVRRGLSVSPPPAPHRGSDTDGGRVGATSPEYATSSRLPIVGAARSVSAAAAAEFGVGSASSVPANAHYDDTGAAVSSSPPQLSSSAPNAFSTRRQRCTASERRERRQAAAALRERRHGEHRLGAALAARSMRRLRSQVSRTLRRLLRHVVIAARRGADAGHTTVSVEFREGLQPEFYAFLSNLSFRELALHELVSVSLFRGYFFF